MANPPESISREAFVQAVDTVIKERKTAKVLGNIDDCIAVPGHLQADFRKDLQEIIQVAGWAPFHKAADRSHLQKNASLNSMVPWRFYVLEKVMCCKVLDFIRTRAAAEPDSVWAQTMKKKIPSLLAGAGALILVTWLPDPNDDPAQPEPALTERNVEHLAAASAAVQNVLLAAEARGMYTYWSSGGVLGSETIFSLLGIPVNQKLIAAVFLAPDGMPAVSIDPGGMRDQRGEPDSWTAWISEDALGE